MPSRNLKIALCITLKSLANCINCFKIMRKKWPSNGQCTRTIVASLIKASLTQSPFNCNEAHKRLYFIAICDMWCRSLSRILLWSQQCHYEITKIHKHESLGDPRSEPESSIKRTLKCNIIIDHFSAPLMDATFDSRAVEPSAKKSGIMRGALSCGK